MRREDKINEGQVLLDDINNYRPQEEGITTVCQAYEAFYIEPLSPPPPSIPTRYLRETLSLMLQET